MPRRLIYLLVTVATRCNNAGGRCMSNKAAANGGCDPRNTRPGWCDRRDCVCCLLRRGK